MAFTRLKPKGKKKGKISHLVLVRHGQSLWNAKNLWTGWQDISLTDKGKTEAREAARLLLDIKFQIAFTSDLSRAYETLEIIKEELKILDIPTHKHPAIKERNYGVYTGKNKLRIKREIGEVKFRKLRRGWNEAIPEGETLRDVYERVVPFFDKHIVPAISKGMNILFVAHGNSNRALMKHLEKIPDEAIEEIEMSTGEVIVYRLNVQGEVMQKEKRLKAEVKSS